jgi:hypothetical protein
MVKAVRSSGPYCALEILLLLSVSALVSSSRFQSILALLGHWTACKLYFMVYDHFIRIYGFNLILR